MLARTKDKAELGSCNKRQFTERSRNDYASIKTKPANFASTAKISLISLKSKKELDHILIPLPFAAHMANKHLNKYNNSAHHGRKFDLSLRCDASLLNSFLNFPFLSVSTNFETVA